MASNPPPPPPPSPPPRASTGSTDRVSALSNDDRETLAVASRKLELGRCLEAESEALQYFAASLIKNYNQEEINVSEMPPGVQDAWRVISEATTASVPPDTSDKPLQIGQGQFGKATQTQMLAKTLNRAQQLSNQIKTEKLMEGQLLRQALNTAKTNRNTDAWMKIFDERIEGIKAYSVRHETQGFKRQKMGNPLSDGYDLASMTQSTCRPILDETLFASEEVMGKYLDLQPIYGKFNSSFKFLQRSESNFAYVDFLELLAKGLDKIPEQEKLDSRKSYTRFLEELQSYLDSFLGRTVPLLDRKLILEPVEEEFEKEWAAAGGFRGWEKKKSEAAFSKAAKVEAIDLTPYETADALEKAIDGDRIKAELARLGLKCGGTVSDRAKRLFMTKDTPLDKLPKKLFAKKDAEGSQTTTSDRRVDIARTECMVNALLNQVGPTLEATIRRAERRQTQTLSEREKELEEELHGSIIKTRPITGDDSDDDEAPIYNPKNVPLDFDGKPIPYWLFKLHGLNHYYPCEICGGESYRGRRNFELHFAEQRHTLGMKGLGIPNTKHFHGVTKIDDAKELWESLQSKVTVDKFDRSQEEEFEDSHGNVLSRSAYESLARQGLL